MNLGDLWITVGARIDGYRSAMAEVRSSMNSTAAQLASTGTAMTAAITIPLVGIATAALKTAGDLEQNTVAFRTLLGSADAASRHLKDLRDFAAKTPFQFTELVLASKRMQALGFEGQQVIPTLRSVGNAAAALGGGAEGVQRIITALGQMKAKGTVQAEEMRQLAEAGIPAWQILAKTLNTDVAGAMKLVERRAVDAAVAVPAILAGMNEKFAGLMDQQSKTLLGRWSDFKDKLGFALTDIGTALAPLAGSIMESFLLPLVKGITDIAKVFGNLPAPVQTAIVALLGLSAAVGPTMFALGKLTTLVTGMGTNLVTLSNTLVNLGASSLSLFTTRMAGAGAGYVAMLATGILRVAGWIGLAYAILKAADAYGQLRDAQSKAEGSEKQRQEGLAEFETRLRRRGANIDAEAKQYSQGIITLDQYRKKLFEVADQLNKNAVVEVKHAQSVNSVNQLLRDAGLKTLEERRKALQQAQTLYAAVVKEYGAGSGIAADALAKLKAAQDDLTPSLENLKVAAGHAMAAFKFGERGFESALLVAELKKAEKGHDEYVAAVIKAGGVTQYAAQEAAKLAEAFRLLGAAPGLDGIGKMTSAVEGLLNAALPIDPTIKAINDALVRLGVADKTVAGKTTTINQLESDLVALGKAVDKGVIDMDVYNRAWIELIHQMDKAGKAIDPADRKRLIELEKQYGGQIKQTAKEMAETANAAARAARKSEQEIRQIGRAFQRSFTNLTRNAIDGLFEGGKVMKNIVTDLSKDMLQILAQLFFNKLKLLFADMLVNAGGSFAKLGTLMGGIAKPGKTAADAATKTAGTATEAAAGAATTATAPAGAGASSAASGAGQFANVFNMVTGAVTAISSVIGNFQMKGINKSLDLIEKATRYTEIYVGGQADSLLATSHLMLARLTDLAASMRGAVKINLDGKITSDEANNLIDNLLNGSMNFYQDTYQIFLKMLQAINSGFATLTGQMHLMVESQPKLWERIVSGFGGILGGIGGAAAGGLGGALGGLVSGVLGGLISGIGSLFGSDDAGMTEVNTRKVFAEVSNLRADEWSRHDQIMTRMGEIWSSVIHLADWGRLTVSKFDEFVIPDLQRIAGALEGGGVGGGGTMTFEFNNCTFGAGTSRESIDAMFQAGFRRARASVG